MNAKTLRKAVNEYSLFAPNTKTDKSNYFDGNIPTADIQKLHAKYAPTEFDFDDHVPTFVTIDDVLYDCPTIVKKPNS